MAEMDIDEVKGWAVPKRDLTVHGIGKLSQELSESLYKDANKDNFEWGNAQQDAFDKLKQARTPGASASEVD